MFLQTRTLKRRSEKQICKDMEMLRHYTGRRLERRSLPPGIQNMVLTILFVFRQCD